MPKPERGSLSVIKRALPNLPPAAPNKELEDRLLAGDAATTAAEADPGPPSVESGAGGTAAVHVTDVHPADIHHPDVQPPIPPDEHPATRLVPRPGKRKEPVQMVTYRIPASLYDRLFRIAEYNNLNMTDIVVEAIDRHLPNFPQPGKD